MLYPNNNKLRTIGNSEDETNEKHGIMVLTVYIL